MKLHPTPRLTVAAFSIVLGLRLTVSPAAAACSSNPYADFIVASTTTTGVASRVLGAPNNQAVDFENDGNNPGFVTVGFNNDVIVDGAGVDFSIYLMDFPAVEQEAFELWVSENGSSWVSLGMVSPTVSSQNQSEKRSFDLQPSGVTVVRQIKVVNGYADTLFGGEGPDLDAFQAVNCGSEAEVGLLECENELDACQTELVTSDRELDECNEDLGSCDSSDQLSSCTSDLATCDGQLSSCSSDLSSCDGELSSCTSDLSSCGQQLGTCSSGLSSCGQQLSSCSSGLAGCGQQLAACSSGLATCERQRDLYQGLVVQCDTALDAAQADLQEVAAGLAEINRLLSQPPGHRRSAFSCSGRMCRPLTGIIQQLVAPPGQSIQPANGKK